MTSPSAAASIRGSSPTNATPSASSARADWLDISLLTAKTITAAAECVPFPYVKAVCGTAVALLETIEKVKKNREDWKELCETTMNIITIVHNQILAHGDSGASQFKKLCEELENFLQEVYDAAQLFQKEPNSFRGQINKIVKLRSTADEISKYGKRIQELRSNFVLAATMEMNFHLAEALPIAPLNNVVATQVTQSINSCPPPSRIFHGRETILAKMHRYYAEDTGKQRIFLLHGLGGAGKTQIALKFIEESSQFSDVFLIDSSTPNTIDTGLMNIAVSKNFGSNAQDALQWISNTSHGWLLFFDNADDPKINLHNYFPRCKHGNILITSRNPALAVYAGAHTVVSDMEETDSVELLLKSAAQDSTPQNQEVATEIVKELCYFPLAIIQAGAFISKSGALNNYLALYSANRVQLLSEKPAQTHDDYASTVYTTWQISFEQLTPPAATLLQLCSFLHHQGISEQIFSNASMYTFPPNGPLKEELEGPLGILSQCMDPAGSWDSLRFMDLINQLRAYSLISFDPATKMFSIHPLVHKWSQSTLTDQREYHSQMVAIIGMSLAAITPKTKYVAGLQLLAHLDSLLQGDPVIAVDFGLQYATIYSYAGQHQKAEPLELAVLQRRRDTLGEDHPDTLTAMDYVAETYHELGRLQEAEALQSVFFEKRKAILGEDHPDTLLAMDNLAKTYHQLSRLQEAEALQIVVLEKRRALLGKDHPQTLTAMVHLAGTYRRLGRMREAEALQIVVVEKRRTTLGEEHPDTLHIMNNLSLTYCNLGQLQEAKALHSIIVEKQKTVLGEDHPETLRAMSIFAMICHQLGQLQEAEVLQMVVLEKRKTILGWDRPHTLNTMLHLAGTYRRLGQMQEAEALQIVVLEKHRTRLGEQHPQTLDTMNDLALTYCDLGRLQEAEVLQSLVFETRKTILGEDHPVTLLAMSNFAVTYRQLSRPHEAEALQSVVLEKRRTLLGEEHPHTLAIMNNLALTYCDLGQLQEAEALQSVVFKKRNTIFGEDHPDTLIAMGNLAKTYCQLGRLQEAEALQSVVFEKRKTLLGEDHPDTLLAMCNLSKTYCQLGRLWEAEVLQSVVIKNRRPIWGQDHLHVTAYLCI